MSTARTDQDLMTEEFKAIPGGGEMGRLIRAHDWTHSSLMSPKSWPQSLRTALSICLGSKFPMVIWWGKDFNVFYNDAYIPILGPQKHPMYIGRPAKEQWPEIWEVVGTLAEHVLSTGEATWSEDQPLFMVRKGFVEEAYFTFSFSPAREESGAVGGMFCAVQEMTARVIGERRLGVLRELSSQEGKHEEDVTLMAAQVLSKSPNDLPFALIYMAAKDEKSAILVGSAGIRASSAAAPERLDLASKLKASWPLAEVHRSGKPQRVDGLRGFFSDDLPKVPYVEMPDSAWVMPIEFTGHAKAVGFLVFGINPRLEFDDSYQGFFTLVCKQITNQLFNVRTLHEERKRSEALAEIDRAKTAFFSNVSHEFRTPLTLMLGPIEEILADREGRLSPSMRAEAEVVHRNSLRLLKLVNALLDFSRIEAGRVQADYVETDLAAFTTDIASGFRSAIERVGMKFDVMAESVTEPVYVDRDMWEKIVLNLMSNAFKYTLQGEIRAELRRVGNHVEFSVTDTGIGISESELSNIFQRFHRVEGVVGRTHEGTGIGLALVQELVNLHGGSIRAKSRAGHGSTFTITLPLGKAHLPKDHISGPRDLIGADATLSKSFTEEALRWIPEDFSGATGEAAAEISPVRRMRILLADDNADMRDYVRKLLENQYDVIAVSDGKRAIEAALTRAPDLILSDIMMPVMDGIELLREVRKHPELHTTPVILLSARAGEEDKASGIEFGADDYLTKPFSAKELLARVNTHLKLAEIRKRASEKDAVVTHLARRQKWLEDVLDLVPTPLLLLELQHGQMRFANQAAHRMAGGQFPMNVPVTEYERKFHVTDEAGNPVPVKDIPGTRAVRGERVRDAEVVWHTPSGSFSLLIDSEQVPPQEGETPLVILSMRDVTHMKEVQKELNRLIGARDEFLSVASHELKTPLTSLRLQTQMVKRGLARGDPAVLEPARLERVIEQTDRQVTRLTQLVDDMLDVSRMETGIIELHREQFDLADLVSDVVERLAPQLSLSGSTVSVQRSEPGAGIVGGWDRFRIEQVLTNLLTNASRYGAGKPIVVICTSQGASAEFAVRDQGKGISEEDQKRIFKRFERATSPNEVSGLGLGLYIASQIVLAHRGTLTVESKPGKGSTFTVKLPVDLK